MANCTICKKHFFGSGKLYDGMCLDCFVKNARETKEELNKTKTTLEETIKKIPKDAHELEALTARNKELREENKGICERIDELSKKLKCLENKILVADDIVELETFSLYRPKFDFCNSAQYKLELDKIREKEKQMIKSKTAWHCSTRWAVNGDVKKGKQMTEGQAKVALRAFNSECDTAVSAVRFSNYEKCEERMLRSFEAINKANAANDITITNEYFHLKIMELQLALEYQIKKQEEKEAIRELRAQQREDARIEKEIEEARKEAEKERKHYLNAIARLAAQISVVMDEQEKTDLLEKEKELKESLSVINKKLADIDYRQENQKAGYVYIISNIGSFGEGIYKIGMTRRLDPLERVDELGDASVPFRFDVHAMIFSADAPKLEAALHRAFEERRVNKVNRRREYFRVSLDEIKEVVKKNHDKTVEFIEAPYANQYRESLLMQNE